MISLVCSSAVMKTAVAQSTTPPPAGSLAPMPLAWTEVSTPFPAVDITAVGNAFWVCGVNEMIASSSDGGNTWQLKHQTPNGKILMHIAFVNDKIGHAAGKGGILLSTTDGGETWMAHNAGDDVQAFSFADAKNGIAVIAPEGDINRSGSSPLYGYHLTPMEGTVKLTHDGGEHWDDIPALNSDELKPFARVVAVAALDASHYLMIRNEGIVEDAFVVTQDAGKSWKLVHQRSDPTNREFAKRIFVHGGEYWAFGTQLLNRESHGGGMASMTRHSKDGETWTAGISAASDMGGCNSQGCYLWDGTVEALYGAHEQYWTLPQDGSLSATWAIAGNRACTVDTTIECGPAIPADQPQPRQRNLPRSAGQPYKITNLPFADDCVTCGVKVIRLDPGKNWQGRVLVSFDLGPQGAVTNLYEDGAPEGPLGALIEDQVQRWRFNAPAADTSTKPATRHLPIDVKCIDAPDVPTMDGCQLTPGKG
jgi:photosystem II stability/assembly factor-like uncharacterized protein